jgi:hypothetical protein
VSKETASSSSQPFIGEGWVSRLFSKLITDRGGKQTLNVFEFD